MDSASLDLKVGFEIHQQLATRSKLFCNCSCEEAQKYDHSFVRKLRPTRSELGAYDPAAMFEFSKMRTVEYHTAFGSSCLVEADEEPPHDISKEALETALIFSLALHSKVMDEVHVMRKRVARGLGSIRQDVNISVQNGAVVEVKGVQQLDQLVKVIEHEMQRQHGLIVIAEKLKGRKVDISNVGDKIEDITDILGKAQSKIVKKILDVGGLFRAIRVPAFAGMIGFEPYPDIRIGKELGKLVTFYELDGVFHSDELPNYGITEQEVAAVRSRLQASDNDAFVIVGGPKDRAKFACDAIIRRLQAAVNGVPAETRAATQDGKTMYLRPRPGAARMYPETDIPTIPVTDSMLNALSDKVPRSWDEMVDSLATRYNLNKKLASQIFDSDYLGVFEEIASATKVQPTFVASKLTEDLTSLQRQGLDASILSDDLIKDIFAKLDSGSIAKESVNIIFERLMKNEARTVDEAIKAAGVSTINDEELGKGLDKIINDNIAVVKEKGMSALSTLMGRAMAEYRGKADGQKINAMVKDKLQKLLK